MPIIHAPKRASQCSKPKCLDRYTSRHHMGSEHMWLKIFVRQSLSKRYIAFKKRYWEFRAEDTVELCKAHHEEIHQIYEATVFTHCMNNKLPIYLWSWKQAEALMADLRKVCIAWLTQETPGATEFKFLTDKRK